MSRGAWLNALLAVAVGALGAWVYFKPSRDSPVEYPLSALKPSEARSIRIERGTAAPIALSQKDGAWRLTAPFAARADAGRVHALLEILEARSSHRLPATDLERFDLAPPRAGVTIDGQTFGYGMVSPVVREQYVLTAGSVFAVSPRYGTALPVGASDLASRSLFGAGEVPVRIHAGAFTVGQRDGRWVLTPGDPHAGQDDLARWMDEWRLATALRVDPHDKGAAIEKIRVQLKRGAERVLGVLAREPHLVLLREDENLRYTFLPEVAKRLLSPPVARKPPATGK